MESASACCIQYDDHFLHRFNAALELLLGNLDDRSRQRPQLATDALVALTDDLKKAKASGAEDKQLDAARNFQRTAQFYLDFVEAENSTGFHAPQEAARILGESIDASRKGQLAARKVN